MSLLILLLALVAVILVLNTGSDCYQAWKQAQDDDRRGNHEG